MAVNPYAAPVDTLTHEPETIDRYATIGQVVVMWEKLRFLYNFVVGSFVLVVLIVPIGKQGKSLTQVLAQVVMGGLFANLCFFTGSFVDGYLTWFGFRQRMVTVVLFVLGTAFTMVLAVIDTLNAATDVCMHHDQGLIPLKALAFGTAVM